MKTKREFRKNQDIRFEKRNYQCICCDDDIAVFAPVVKRRNGTKSVKFKEMFAGSNNPKSGSIIEYEKVG